MQLVEDAGLGAAAHRAAGAGDDAVGALAVAAVLYFNERERMSLEPLHGQLLEQLAPLVGRDGHDPLVAIQQLEHIVEDGFTVAVAADEVGFHEVGRLFGEGLRVAAGQHRDGTGVLTFCAAEPFAALLVAEVGDGAAVDHKDVGLLALRDDGEARAPEHLLQRPGLVQVDLAAKGIKTNSHESILSMNGLAFSVSLRSLAPQRGGRRRASPFINNRNHLIIADFFLREKSIPP